MSEITQNILEALRVGGQAKTEKVQADLAQQRIQLANQQALEDAKQQQDKLRQQQKEFDAQHNLAMKTFEVMKQAKAIENMKAEAALNPGAVRELSQAEQGPKTEGAIAIDTAQANQQRQTLTQTGQQRLGELTLGAGYDEMVSKKKEAAANWRAMLAANTDRYVANVRQQGLSMTYDPGVWVKGLADGTYNRDDVLKSLPKQDAMQVLNLSQQSKVVPLTVEQQKFAGEYQPVLNAMTLMDEFTKNVHNSGDNRLTAFGSGLMQSNDADVVNAEKQLVGRATPIARTVAREMGNISDADISRVVGGYIPTRYDTDKAKLKKVSDFKRDIVKVFDAKMKNLLPEQRQIIKEKYGIDKIEESLKGTSSAPNATTPVSRIKILSVE